MLEIIEEPNKILRRISEEVDIRTLNSPDLRCFINEMIETMNLKDGLGLAAPQVGQNIRIIAVKDGRKDICMINPKITKKSWARLWDEEGCLSVPGYFGKVQRYKKINCCFFDKEGRPQKIQAEDLLARVIQHEIDHLDGVLFIDKALDLKKQVNQSSSG